MCAHRLSTHAGPRPGQEGYVAAGIRDDAAHGAPLASGQARPTLIGNAFRQAAVVPIFKSGHRCVADAGARLVLSPDTAATYPGRAVLRSRQLLAAECALGFGPLVEGRKSRYSSWWQGTGRSVGAAARAVGGRLTRLDRAPRYDAAAPGRMGDLNPAGLGLR